MNRDVFSCQRIEVTEENDLLSVVHISRHADAVKAAKFGASGLAHIWLFDTLGIVQKDLIQLKESGIFIVPTLLVYKRGVERKGHPDNMALLKSEVKRLYDAGIPILAGTDPPNYKVNFGTDLIEELALFVECGLPPLEALKSAIEECLSS